MSQEMDDVAICPMEVIFKMKDKGLTPEEARATLANVVYSYHTHSAKRQIYSQALELMRDL